MPSNILFLFAILFVSSFQNSAVAKDAATLMDQAQQAQQVLRLLQNPSDNDLASAIKPLIATYLVETTNLDEGKARFESLPIPYGKHKHQSQRDRYAELLQKLQEQEKQLQQVKQQAAPVPASVPAPPPPPPATQEAKQESVASVPVVQPPSPIVQAPAVTPSVEQKRQEIVTQIPVILSTPPPPVATPPPAIVAQAATTTTTTQAPASTRPTVDPVHHLNQVNKILGNVANGNIVGIVDESLAIRAPAPVRNLVTNIMKVIFCNPIDRLFGRCAPNQIDAANNSVKGK